MKKSDRPWSPLSLGELRAANAMRQKVWDPNGKIDLMYRTVELGGELGEAWNVIKKIERERRGIRGSRATKEQLAEELADVIICTDLLAMHENIDLSDAVKKKFNKTSDENDLGVWL